MFMIVLWILVIFISLILFYINSCFNYWRKRNLAYLKPSLPFGNMENPFTTKNCLGLQYKKFYDEFKKMGAEFGGVYFSLFPVYVPISPDAVKSVLSKDFSHFESRGFYTNEKDQPVSMNLFTLHGKEWKTLRAQISPSFTAGNMKVMFETLLKCSEPFEKKVKNFAQNMRPLDIKQVAGCFMMDTLTSCIFGVEGKCFVDDEPTLYSTATNAIKEANAMIKGAFCYGFPNLAKFFGTVLVPKNAENFFLYIVEETVAYREQYGVRRNDFLQIFIDKKNNTDTKGSISDLAAESFLFLLAGFETPSITVTYCLYELAQHLDIQQKARDEINSVLKRYEGKLTYDAIKEMKYLCQIIDEALRKYPIGSILNRVCTKDFTLPDGKVTIEKGTKVVLPVLGLHRDPEFYPDPLKFDPDRFSEENKRNLVPYTYLPFGDGPRNCIAFRFGLLQVRVALALLLKKFKFTLNSKTKVPLEYSTLLLLAPADDVLLDVSVIE